MSATLRLLLATCIAVAADARADTSAPPAAPPRVSALFEMLGMADEYISRFDHYTGKPVPGQVEHFYPAETALADRYEQLMRRLAAERHIAPRYRRKVSPEGHITFESDAFSKVINSYYIVKAGTLDPRVLRAASRDEQLSYLWGFFRRYGRDGSNVAHTANAASKIDIVAETLVQCGASGVETRSYETIPTIFEVSFQRGRISDGALPVTRWLGAEELARGRSQPARDMHRF